MARTHGHGNPRWSRDETILALQLYQDLNGNVPSGKDTQVRELSEILRRLPYHPATTRKDSFRNPDGVAFKLQNLRHVATGKGLGKVSKMDRAIWAELGGRPEETKRLAEMILAAVKHADELQTYPDVDDEDEFLEGRVLTQNHKRRERSPKLRRHLLAQRQKKGPLKCDMCHASSMSLSAKFEDASFEVHHLIPVSTAEERKTRISDVALLCANCHRLLHRAISNAKRWLTLDEGRSIMQMRG